MELLLHVKLCFGEDAWILWQTVLTVKMQEAIKAY